MLLYFFCIVSAEAGLLIIFMDQFISICPSWYMPIVLHVPRALSITSNQHFVLNCDAWFVAWISNLWFFDTPFSYYHINLSLTIIFFFYFYIFFFFCYFYDSKCSCLICNCVWTILGIFWDFYNVISKFTVH